MGDVWAEYCEAVSKFTKECRRADDIARMRKQAEDNGESTSNLEKQAAHVAVNIQTYRRAFGKLEARMSWPKLVLRVWAVASTTFSKSNVDEQCREILKEHHA